jgi:D-glycero-alpha-D-manno-heptose-7-phosphate kinase
MFQYPYASVSQLQLPNTIWWELERRLVLIFLGKSHHSSQVHEMVIRNLEGAGPECKQLEALRQTAPMARDALYNGDFASLGKAMTANTEAQRQLHPALVGSDAQAVIEIAQAHAALGWKVNGAGGEGGSLTLLCGERSDAKRRMLREIEQAHPGYRNIPTYLSRYGLRVWKVDGQAGQ